MEIKRSLGKKIPLTMVLVLSIILIPVILFFSLSLGAMYKTLLHASLTMGETAEIQSGDALTQRMMVRLEELASDKAETADLMFAEFKQAVCMEADAATRIYSGFSRYPDRTTPLPDAANDGELAIQILYADGIDPDDDSIRTEALKMGNVQDTLLSINNNNEYISSNYVATESGIMFQADYISAKKFDENGNILPYNAKERPWYKGASETGEPFIAPVTKDVHTGRLGLMCGVPIFNNGRLKGVAGAGMYLDRVEELVENVSKGLGENGDACVIDEAGRIVISTYSGGALEETDEDIDLRESDNKMLANVVARAVSGESGSTLLHLDGTDRYAAYAPMNTVGWTFIILLSKGEVEQPVNELMGNLDKLTDESMSEASGHISKMVTLLVITLIPLIILGVLISIRLSARVVRPLCMLTDEVCSIEGDNLDFECRIKTGDEIEALGNSFQSLTDRMKTYIKDIQTITAEKERIGAELNVATQIQADMLPCIFPPFPEREDIDIYASMTPAKEVGGDFYDFFLTDDDHLVMVMADVSGKGVPAALFMVISKTLINDHARMIDSPAQILDKVNELLIESNSEGMFVTVWLGILEISTGRIICTNAGHELPALRKADGEFELVKNKHGMMVGVMSGLKFNEYEMQLEKGGTLFLYTDGVPEATNAENELFRTERMVEALNINPSAPPEEILKTVKAKVDEFVGEAPQFDDLTMLAITRK